MSSTSKEKKLRLRMCPSSHKEADVELIPQLL